MQRHFTPTLASIYEPIFKPCAHRSLCSWRTRPLLPFCSTRLLRFPHLASVLLALLLGACATPAPPGSTPPLLPVVVVQAPAPPAQPDASAALLLYADRVRGLPAAELTAEAAALASPEPADQLKLALVLHQQQQLQNQRLSSELTRAQDLLAQVLANDSPTAQALHPLARLLAARYADQRRLEEQADRQAQQLREQQRRLDQTTERLEALKAIEHSLRARPTPLTAPVQAAPAAPAAPANGQRAPSRPAS